MDNFFDYTEIENSINCNDYDEYDDMNDFDGYGDWYPGDND